MNALLTAVTVVVAGIGCAFVCVGTLGLYRLGDLRSRLHAVTKADTLGLGLIILAVLPHSGSVAAAVKLLLIWVVGLASAAVLGHLLARGHDDGTAPRTPAAAEARDRPAAGWPGPP